MPRLFAPPAIVSVILVGSLVLCSRSSSSEPFDWPQLLHDPALTGTSHLACKIQQPHLAWSVPLGLGRPEAITDRTRAAPVSLDLNGDGVSETVECQYASRSFLVLDGATRGRLWSAEVEQPILEQLFSVADVNADGRPDLCLVTHYRAEVFAGNTGQRLHKIAWNVGRNYGLNHWGNFDDDPQLECAILSDYTAHVDLLDTGPGGKGAHLWSSVYRRDADENAPLDYQRGRRELRYLYRSVSDLDGDGRPELVYMVFNQADRREWRTLVRRLPGGETIADLEHQFVHGIEDWDGDRVPELCTTRLHSFGTNSFGELKTWNLVGNELQQVHDLGRGRYLLAFDQLPPSAAAGGQQGAERCTVAGVDSDNNGIKALIVVRDRNADGVQDELELCELGAKHWKVTAKFADSNQSHVAEAVARTEAGAELRGYDLKTSEELLFRAADKLERGPASRTWSLLSDPVAGDLDADGICEIAVQASDGQILVFEAAGLTAPRLKWSRRGWGMNQHPGYTRPSRGIVLADLNSDGKGELLFAERAQNGDAAFVAIDCAGQTVWNHSISGLTQDWPDSGIDQWTVGKFNEDAILDVVVQYHDLGHSSGKLTALDGRNGQPLWKLNEVNVGGVPRPPSSIGIVAADFDGDFRDDVGLMPLIGFAALRGATGAPLAAVRFYPPDPARPDEWKPKDCDAPFATKLCAQDADGDRACDVFFSDRLTQAALRPAHQPTKLWVVGEPHPEAPPVTFRAPDNPLVFDADNDGRLEFCAFHPRRLVIHEATTGAVRAEWPLPETPTGEAIACDIDGDGRRDLLFPAGNKLCALSIAGEKLFEPRVLWSHEFSTAVGTPIIADLARDGAAEIVVPTADAQLHCLADRPGK